MFVLAGSMGNLHQLLALDWSLSWFSFQKDRCYHGNKIFLRFIWNQTYRFFFLVYFICYVPTGFVVFCLWQYRIYRKLNQDKLQCKTNNWCKFHIDLTEITLLKSELKKLGMVSRKLYRNTLNEILILSTIPLLLTDIEQWSVPWNRALRLAKLELS